MTDTTFDIEVCEDCYVAHHYGAREHEGKWYAGESDTPCAREPLGLVDDTAAVFDHTCSNHYYGQDIDPFDNPDEVPCEHCGEAGDDNGMDNFVMAACQGCGDPLGGVRYRLRVEPRCW